MADTPSSPAGDGGESGGGSVREQDRYLPIANISRIMKKALPPNGKIGKDAKDTVQECVSEFISFITSEYVLFLLYQSLSLSLSFTLVKSLTLFEFYQSKCWDFILGDVKLYNL